LKIIRWFLAGISAPTGALLALYCTAWVSGYLGLLLKPYCIEWSYVCLDPWWVSEIPVDTLLLLSSTLSPFLFILLGSLIAPIRKSFVPLIFLFSGLTIPAYLLLAGANSQEELLLVHLPMIITGLFTTYWLRRTWFIERIVQEELKKRA